MQVYFSFILIKPKKITNTSNSCGSHTDISIGKVSFSPNKLKKKFK